MSGTLVELARAYLGAVAERDRLSEERDRVEEALKNARVAVDAALDDLGQAAHPAGKERGKAAIMVDDRLVIVSTTSYGSGTPSASAPEMEVVR